jgi:hypothetical protein
MSNRYKYEFHARHGITAKRCHGKREADLDIIRWCFTDAEIAKEFASAFSRLVSVPK